MVTHVTVIDLEGNPVPADPKDLFKYLAYAKGSRTEALGHILYLLFNLPFDTDPPVNALHVKFLVGVEDTSSLTVIFLNPSDPTRTTERERGSERMTEIMNEYTAKNTAIRRVRCMGSYPEADVYFMDVDLQLIDELQPPETLTIMELTDGCI